MDKQSNENNERKYTVYLHVVPKQISGYKWDKYYVGITSRDVKKRWKNGEGYYQQPYFYRAIQKYGWSNIRHLILKTNLSEQEAVKWEQNYIRIYKSYQTQFGYNQTMGGDLSSVLHWTDEARNRRSQRMCGEGNHFYGKKHSNKTKKLISQNHINVMGVNNPNHKTIYQFDLNGNYITSYPSTMDAARANNIKSQSDLSAVARHETKTASGYIWLYEDAIEKTESGYKITNNYHLTPKRLNKKKILVFNDFGELIKTYESAQQAAKETISSIGAIARGSNKHHSSKTASEFYKHYYQGCYYYYEQDQDATNRFLEHINSKKVV